MIGRLQGIALTWAILLLIAGAAAPSQAGGEPGLVSSLRANGAAVLPLGARGGLDGYFVTPSEGAGYSLYVTGDGHAVAGLLYGPDGSELTGAQLAEVQAGEAPVADAAAVPADDGAEIVSAHAATDAAGTPSTSQAALFERSSAAFGFALGERGPQIVLFGDPACRWSRSAAARLGREALAGRLRLRVVPVAVLGADAARRAAGIAASPDPALAWFEGNGHPPDRRGGERIARNNALFDAWGADAVPLIAWRGRDGAVRHRVGDVDDVGAWLKEAGLE